MESIPFDYAVAVLDGLDAVEINRHIGQLPSQIRVRFYPVSSKGNLADTLSTYNGAIARATLLTDALPYQSFDELGFDFVAVPGSIDSVVDREIAQNKGIRVLVPTGTINNPEQTAAVLVHGYMMELARQMQYVSRSN